MRRSASRTVSLVGLVMLAIGAWAATPASAALAPLSELGSPGTGAGQLTGPSGIAIDDAGRIYVADVSRARIAVFSADGTFIHAFGLGVRTGASSFEVCTTATGCLPGIEDTGAAGELSGPRGIALDPAGNLYVAEDDAPRISVIDPSGPTFLRAFGYGVHTPGNGFETCTTATGCMSGDSGAAAGQLSFTHGLAFDGAGNLYVSDSGNHRISVYSTAGPSFVRSFGYGVHTGGSSFETCTTQTGCVSGVSGGAAGQLNFPTDLALTGTGLLYVSEGVNHRISAFDVSVPATPAFDHAFGQGVANGSPAFQVCTDPCQGGTPGNGAGAMFQPIGMALDGTGDLLVAESGNNRVSSFSAAPSFISAFGAGVDTGASMFETCTSGTGCQIGVAGGPGALNTPKHVEVDVCGGIWVSDQSGRVLRYGEPGTEFPPTCMPPTTTPKAKCGGRTATTVGTAGRDHLRGTKGADVIAALGGRDIVNGLAGNDVICGGGGRDSLFGGPGRDRLLGQAGRDTCNGGPKHDASRACEVRKRI